MIPARANEALVWHELECGGYRADLPLWLELAASSPGPVLDIGAGAGRVSGPLAQAGAEVVALDQDAGLLAALVARWPQVRIVVADARKFSFPHDFGLIVVPMQTIQLLGGRAGRAALLACARAHLRTGGLLACAIADELESYGLGPPLPEPDRAVHGEVMYESQPVALRERPGAWELERLRSVRPPGELARTRRDVVYLDRVSPDALRAEGEAQGLRALAHRNVAASTDHAGSTVVVWRD